MKRMAALLAKTARARMKSSPPSFMTTTPSLVRWLTIAPPIAPSASAPVNVKNSVCTSMTATITCKIQLTTFPVLVSVMA
jgi:hypothetical protein